MPYVRPLSIEMNGRESSGPNTYAEVLMGSADAEGYPFWAPRSMGVVGDCGMLKIASGMRPYGQWTRPCDRDSYPYVDSSLIMLYRGCEALLSCTKGLACGAVTLQSLSPPHR